MEKPIPLIVTKAWISLHFEHSFKWVRRHLLTDDVVINKLDFDLQTFKNRHSFPPDEGTRIKQYFKGQNLI